jgi:hypothetical protein
MSCCSSPSSAQTAIAPFDYNFLWSFINAIFSCLVALAILTVLALPFLTPPMLLSNQESNSFMCLDQSQTIPLSALNHGKCDCLDSSDEP